MNCGRIALSIDDCDLPGAAADPAEAPVAPTKTGGGELAVAGVARAYARFEFDQGAGSIEHSFAILTATPLARLFDEAQIDQVSRRDPPAHLGWVRREMNAVAVCLD